jgi:hypothetical protein
MKYIANIITKSKSYNFSSLINVNYSINEIDKSIPTLIVGIDNVKTIFNKDKINYLFRQIDETTSWTYSTIEDRSKNEEDVEIFKKKILKILKNKIQYKYVNVLTLSKQKMFCFLRFLKNDIMKYFYFTNKMLYIAYEDTVLGISLDDCEYIGLNRDRIKNKVLKNFKNIASHSRYWSNDEKLFFQNDEILLSAMFCYANS